ncbi:hypothetical protein GCM10020258_56740 [Sphingomonas yabuuchiae]
MTQPPLRMIAHRFGIPMEVLACEPLGRPPVAYGEVLVRMTATPINPSDLIPVAGAYAARTSLPFVPGYEGTGTIEEVGDNVDPGLIGRRVLPLGSAGCWQTLKVLPADWCILVPDDVDDDEAATAYINPLTALLMVRRMAPQPGDAVRNHRRRVGNRSHPDPHDRIDEGARGCHRALAVGGRKPPLRTC